MKPSMKFVRPTRLLVGGVYLEGHGVGFAWAFFGPHATLFDAHDEHQVITHFNSPNPGEGGRERPTWQHSRDTSAVWANNTFPPAESSTDPAFVRQDAIPWLLLPVASTEPGPKGPGTLTETTFIFYKKTH